MIPKTIIHLLSGGLDSVTLMYHLKRHGHAVHAVLFDYKQTHAQELRFAITHCRRLGVLWTTVELPPLHGLTDKSWIVPNRNAVMLSVAVNLAARANADTVTIGCNADDVENFPDCRPDFIKSMNEATHAAGYAIDIWAPFLDWRKWQIGGLAREMAIPLNEIWSCYRGGAKPCGNCPACAKLEAATR